MYLRQVVPEQVELTWAEPVRVEAVQPQTDQAARQSQLSPEHSMCVWQVASEQVEPTRVEAAQARAD